MDLRQSLIIEALGKPVAEGCVCEAPRVRAEQIAKQVFAMAKQNGRPFLNIDYKQWAKKWLASDEFVLTEINASSVAIPVAPKNPHKVMVNMRANAQSFAPIVVDLNKRGIGRAPGSGYIPPVIVVDGKHRQTASMINGRETIKAWVGVKALDKVTKAYVDIKASVNKMLPQSRLDTTAQLYAGMGGTPVPRQDSGDGGAKPTMAMPGVKATGPAMEPVTKGQAPEVYSKKMKANGGTGGPGGMTSGPTPKILGDASDSGQSVIDPSDMDASDKVQTSTGKCQTNDQPVKSNAWSSEQRGKNNPVSVAPGSGVGPRLNPNHGASRSDLSKVMAGKVGTIKTVAPPGFSEATMHQLKRKHGVANAFKIAWSQHNKVSKK